MNNIFICPKCKNRLDLFKCGYCGLLLSQVNSIFQFCDDPPLKLEGGDKYIGYDFIGEDFDPTVKFWNTNNVERYGVYEACSDIIAKKFGNDIIALDLGAGLGSASIPLAKNGIYTIAADISNVMLSTGVKRSAGRLENLVFARMNAYSLMLDDSSVDIVVENAMLHLVDNPGAVLKEICRVLKPGGCLIRYGSPSQKMTEEEKKINRYCNNVLKDISEVYHKTLDSLGYKSILFDNNFIEKISQYFNSPYNEASPDFTEVFTEKLKFRLHRMKTGAHSDFQNTPRELIDNAWQVADRYAREKYGQNYAEIKGFSRYGAAIDIYKLKESY